MVYEIYKAKYKVSSGEYDKFIAIGDTVIIQSIYGKGMYLQVVVQHEDQIVKGKVNMWIPLSMFKFAFEQVDECNLDNGK